jgi:Neuralized
MGINVNGWHFGSKISDFLLFTYYSFDFFLESFDSESVSFEFSDLFGKNMLLSDDKKSASRAESYNQGVVVVGKPLCRGHSISVS